MNLEENEKIEDLQLKGLQIIQNKKWFCFGMDAVLLSDFAKKIKPNATVVDLGAGTGIISILLSAKTKASKIKCVEKQKEMAKLIEKNIELNKLENKLELINKDILKLEIKENSVDAVVTNPPYKKQNTGIKNGNEQKFISKVETTAALEDFIKVSKKILKDKGQFFMVHRPDRLVDIIYLMRKYKIEPKRIKFVYTSKLKQDNAKLILVEGIKNAKPFLKVEKSIYVYDENGKYTNEINKIYNRKDENNYEKQKRNIIHCSNSNR